MSQLKKVISGLSFEKSEKNLHNLQLSVEKYSRINSLKKGYSEMALINLDLVRECFEAENEDFLLYEEKLTERE